MNSVLALDLARKTGWAFRDGDGLLTYNVREFDPPGACPGGYYSAFGDWFSDMITDLAPGFVAIEKPVVGVGIKATEHALSFGAIAQFVCYRRGVPITRVYPTTIKKHTTGSGRASKADVIAWARSRGWSPQDDNVADALALLDYVLSLDAIKTEEAA